MYTYTFFFSAKRERKNPGRVRDIHIECTKQFKWNLYFYVSRQSWPFWAALKLLWISNMKFEYLILILWAKWMPIAFELQQVLSFVFINCFQIELCCLNSLKELDIVNWWHVIANWSSKCIKEMVLKVLSCSPNDEKKR